MIILACGSIYTSKQSSITHGNYPADYLPNQDCTYTINAPKNYRIVFYFQRFELERSYNCEKDYLQISEGIDNEKRHLGRYCGRNQPGTTRTEKGVLTVRFVTNDNTQDGGFKATYYFEYIPKITTTVRTSKTKPGKRSKHWFIYFQCFSWFCHICNNYF